VARDGRRSRFGAAGRLAFFPARAAARATRGPIEAAADEHLVPEVSKLVDRALASDLPEELARSIAQHHVLERVTIELAENGALESAVEQLLASPRTKETIDRLLQSDEVRHAIKEVVASPELRAALAEQTAGFGKQMSADISRRSRELDDRIEARVRRRPQMPGSRFAGLATRAVVLVVDGPLILVIYALVVGLLTLLNYFVELRPKSLVETLLGIGFAVVAASYLAFFWSATGRTPGMQLAHVRVRDQTGKPPSILRAIVRVLATWISIVPLFLGYVTVLFDERRRGLPDIIARTEVFYSR
jgi:uncharacterized RDD family membrane protein YckC